MTDVKRYGVYDRHLSQGGGHEIEEDPDGNYVTYDDYAALEVRIEELEAKLSKYVKACSDLSQQHISEWGRAAELEVKLATARRDALERILNERGKVFDAMVEAAEDAAGKDVSFNVVVGHALLAGIAELRGGNNDVLRS
jgi:hypothetical protein